MTVSRHPDEGAGPIEDRRAATLAFADQIRANEAVLLAVARRLCGNHADALDLLQDAFERALRSHDQFRPDSNLRAWLVTILHNLHIDRWRARQRSPRSVRIESVKMAAAESDASPAWSSITLQAVRAALARLPPEFRSAYELHIDGRSYEDIAALLGIPKSTVGTRLARARKKLRALLEECGGRSQP